MAVDFHTTLSVAAPAKINLFLQVLRKRADEYHDLYSWMHAISLCDQVQIRLTKNPDIILHCAGSGALSVPAGESNLAWQAAMLFSKQYLAAEKPGAVITLEKNIPVAAGLGGGSSDAAAVLRGLNTLYHFPFSQQQLLAMGKCLGADVPFFVADYTSALATGIGDLLEKAPPLPENLTIILVNPGFAVSTHAVFTSLTLTDEKKKTNIFDFFDLLNSGKQPVPLVNDLESVTLNMHPELELTKKVLLEKGAVAVLLSGSGPTVFALFNDRDFPDPSRYELLAQHLREFLRSTVFICKVYTAGA